MLKKERKKERRDQVKTPAVCNLLLFFLSCTTTKSQRQEQRIKVYTGWTPISNHSKECITSARTS